jgi:uncharacterized protein with ParB-like and HNH nuclease domain
MKNKDSLSIAQILEMIFSNELCVPIIQRDFIWEPEKITLLFILFLFVIIFLMEVSL